MTFCIAEDGTTVTDTVFVRGEVEAAIEAGDILVTSLRMAAMSSLVVVRVGFLSWGLVLVEVDLVSLVILVEGAVEDAGIGAGVIDVVRGGGRGAVVVVAFVEEGEEEEGDELVLTLATANTCTFALGAVSDTLFAVATTVEAKLCLLLVHVPTESEQTPSAEGERTPSKCWLPVTSSKEERPPPLDVVFVLLVRLLRQVGGGKGMLECV